MDAFFAWQIQRNKKKFKKKTINLSKSRYTNNNRLPLLVTSTVVCVHLNEKNSRKNITTNFVYYYISIFYIFVGDKTIFIDFLFFSLFLKLVCFCSDFSHHIAYTTHHTYSITVILTCFQFFENVSTAFTILVNSVCHTMSRLWCSVICSNHFSCKIYVLT